MTTHNSKNDDVKLTYTPDGWPEGNYVYRDRNLPLKEGEILVSDGWQGVYLNDGRCYPCKIIKLSA